MGKRTGKFAAIVSGMALLWQSSALLGEEPSFDPFRTAPYSSRRTSVEHRLTQLEAEQPFDVSRPSFATEAFQPFDTGEGGFSRPSFSSPFRTEEAADPLLSLVSLVEQVSGSEQVALAATTDAASLLVESNSVQTVEAQRRSPVAFDPHIRGYSAGQVYTVGDGAYWMPVRQDLDSMLSKIDPALIKGMTVIPGPYGVAYGPGFSFIAVETEDTPRYCNGFEAHNRFGYNYIANGQQMYGRDTVSGGNANYGFRISYGNRNGSDYYVGGNAPISRVPSSYLNQNFLGQFGFDLSENSSVEFRYNRLDQANTEYAVQFFDVDYLETDGLNLAYRFQHPVFDRQSRVELWYNRTRFFGDTARANKRSAEFPVISRVDAALETNVNAGNGTPGNVLGETNGDLVSTGGRAYTLWGAEDSHQLKLGADMRFLEQHLREDFSFTGFGGLGSFFTNMPRAQMTDPGAFAELTLPVNYWTVKTGGRVDWVNSTAFAHEVRPGSSLPDPATFDQNDMLYAFYVTNDIELTCTTTLHVGGGHAQRSPTLLERYADGIFLGIIQSGFSRVIGNPNLRKERNWQIDVGMDVELDYSRYKANFFSAWIDDFITYEANIAADPSGARLLRSINTANATLGGASFYGEVDLTEEWVAFGSVSYVEGLDQEIGVPLPQIAPLESRVGLRFEERSDDATWGGEIGVRIVDNQDRIARFRTIGGTGAVPVETTTPGFTVTYIRGYYSLNDRWNLVGGIDNLFDRTYLEHLNLRLPDQTATLNGQATTFRNTVAYSPGITPYIGVEWLY